jgi:hypothetical protein
MQFIPGPPFKKFAHPTLGDRARDILEKVHDVIPECFVVEVTVHGAPR